MARPERGGLVFGKGLVAAASGQALSLCPARSEPGSVAPQPEFPSSALSLHPGQPEPGSVGTDCSAT